MHKLMLAAVGACLLSATAMAQTPTFPAEAASLTWMEGARVHTNANGTPVYEAFIGPVNGVVTGLLEALERMEGPLAELPVHVDVQRLLQRADVRAVIPVLHGGGRRRRDGQGKEEERHEGAGEQAKEGHTAARPR